jgi:hypothetical protein
LLTTGRWLAMGPAGINSFKVGDLVVRLGRRQVFYALRPLADGIHLSPRLVGAEPWPLLAYSNKGDHKPDEFPRHFKIR